MNIVKASFTALFYPDFWFFLCANIGILELLYKLTFWIWGYSIEPLELRSIFISTYFVKMSYLCNEPERATSK